MTRGEGASVRRGPRAPAPPRPAAMGAGALRGGRVDGGAPPLCCARRPRHPRPLPPAHRPVPWGRPPDGMAGWSLAHDPRPVHQSESAPWYLYDHTQTSGRRAPSLPLCGVYVAQDRIYFMIFGHFVAQFGTTISTPPPSGSNGPGSGPGSTSLRGRTRVGTGRAGPARTSACSAARPPAARRSFLSRFSRFDS